MLSRLACNATSIALKQLRLQTAKMCVPTLAVAELVLGKHLDASRQHQYRKKSYLIVSKANYATCNPIAPYSYEEVKDLPNHPDKLLIDVREPTELQKTGQIPCSINIPLGSVANELSSAVSTEVFEKKYGRKKPLKDSEIIFHCQSGKRSTNASEIAVQLGYTNVKNYQGSWLDWAEREGLPK